MRLHINHKHLLKIQNRGKECAFPWFLIFLNLHVSSQYRQTFVTSITKQSKPQVAFLEYRLYSDAISWKNYHSNCRFHRQRLVFHGFAWNKFMFKFQNSSIKRQMFVKTIPRFCVEPKIFPAVFGHIFVIIGMIIFSIER